MPEYRFKDKTTGKSWLEWMTISERDEFTKNPNIEQMVHGAPRIVSSTGTHFKVDSDFRSKLKSIKKNNPGSKFNIH